MGRNIDSGKYGDLSVVLGEGRGPVCSPQLVWPVDDDGARVWVLRFDNCRSARRKQVMLPHEPQDSVLPFAAPKFLCSMNTDDSRCPTLSVKQQGLIALSM